MNQNDLNEIYQGFEHFFPEGGSPRNEPLLRWKGRADFVKEIKGLTNIDISSGNQKLIKDSQQVLENIAVSTEKAKTNTLTQEQLETFEKEKVAKEEKRQEAIKKSKAAVEREIQQQQELHDKLAAENKKVFVKVEEPKPQEIDPNKLQKIEDLRNQAKIDPEQFKKDLTESLKVKLAGQERVDYIAEKIALDARNGLLNPATQKATNIEVAIFNKVSADTQFPDGIRAGAGELGFYLNSTDLSRSVLSAIDKDFAFAAFGFDPKEYAVSFSEKATPGYTETFDPKVMGEEYINLLQNQGAFLQNIGGLTQGEAQNFLMGQARNWLDGQVAGLSPEVVGVYNSPVVQQSLEFVGFGKAIPFRETFTGGAVMKIPGASSFFEGLGKVTGIDFMGSFGGRVATDAAKSLGKEVAVQAGKTAITVGGETAVGGITGLGLAATITAAFAWTGPLAPVIGAVGAFLVETVATKIIGKIVNQIKSRIPWGGIKKWSAIVVGGVAGLIAIPIVGVGGALGIGAVVTGISAAFGAGLGGATLGGIGGVVAGFFGALGGATLGEIGVPILVTFVGFPVVVALILFIINSGAYVVPPGSYSNNGPHDCSIGVKIVDRAKAINNNLQLGFNHYYNKSPDYPELWNATLFAQNPNPIVQNAVIGMGDMFWCNYTPIKSYLAINENIPFSLTTMMNYFQSQGKWVSGDTATTDEVCPGDSIFFRSPAGSPFLAHVAVVYSVSADEIITVQSNSPWKTMTYFTDASGHFPVFGGGNDTIKIAGFGAP